MDSFAKTHSFDILLVYEKVVMFQIALGKQYLNQNSTILFSRNSPKFHRLLKHRHMTYRVKYFDVSWCLNVSIKSDSLR